MATVTEPTASADRPVLQRLSTLDRFLPVWILLAMAIGLGLGAAIPSINDGLDKLRIGTVSLPIALGLLLMMYPVLAKVRYGDVARDRSPETAKMLGASLILNWVVGPALMFALAWIFLADQPEFRTGLIIVGLARCIAMVLIWSDLSCADRESTALLVAINSVFQIVAYSVLGWFYLTALPDLLGLDSQGFSIGIWEVARTVLIFLGIPLVAGALTRYIGVRRMGEEAYETRFLPKIGPFALYGLLFTIVMLFAIQGDAITSEPLDVARIALPLLVYFAVMFSAGLAAGRLIGATYARTASLAFTAAGNNFELAIAVAIGVFGATSGQALAGVVGPLIEVPVLVGLVYVALWIRRRWYPPRRPPPAAATRRHREPTPAPSNPTEDPSMRHVLFVCNHNAGRSQIAQAFFDRLAPDDVRAESAGTQPAKAVWPVVVEAMAEVGIDLSQEKPTKLTTEMQLHADWAVTMGCGDACPFVPAMVQEWDVEDPSTLSIERVREIRDQIESHVKNLLAEHLQDIYLDRTAHQLRLERLLPAVREDLGDRFSEQQIRACSDQVLAGYDDATVRGHVMTIAHRDVTECLTAGNCA